MTQNASSLNNAFFGALSGRYNTSGSFNSFFGKGSGWGNTTGDNVPLVKAVQELSTNVEEQKKLIEQQQKQIEILIAGMNSNMEIRNTEVGGTSRAFLQQNNPNPFTSETEIRMTLGETVAQATIMIYNLEGREMKNIAFNDRGEVSVKISGNELPAGMYLYTLIADGKAVDTKRMILTQR